MNSPNQLSFLPDDYLERKAQRRTNAICAVLFLVVMVTIGSAFTITERSLRTIEKEHARVEQQYTEAAKRIAEVQQMQEKQRTMARQAGTDRIAAGEGAAQLPAGGVHQLAAGRRVAAGFHAGISAADPQHPSASDCVRAEEGGTDGAETRIASPTASGVRCEHEADGRGRHRCAGRPVHQQAVAVQAPAGCEPAGQRGIRPEQREDASVPDRHDAEPQRRCADDAQAGEDCGGWNSRRTNARH